MIIPYGHEGMRVRGLPWVTITIFVLCCVTFLLTSRASERATQESQAVFVKIAEVFLLRPGLVLDPDLEKRLLRQLGVDDNQREVFLQSLIEKADDVPVSGPLPTQQDLDTLVRQFWAAYRGSPEYRFGVVPKNISFVSLLTYQFMHGGWVHLLGNLLFLYLVGPHIEERWGRLVFGGFYLLAGVVAAVFWAFRYPEIDLPLVGASGSIAGVMGAFLICYGTSKIRFFYWFFIVWGTFEAPAWLMLPLWLVTEVISGRNMDLLSSEGGGVAHWAHVWGFIFGAGFAYLMVTLGLDQRLAERSADSGSAEVPVRVPQAPLLTERPANSGPSAGVRTPSGDAHLAGPGASESEVLEAAPRAPSAIRTMAEPEISLQSPPQPAPRHKPDPNLRLRLVEAVPRGLDGDSLVFEVNQSVRTIRLDLIEALAVAAISRVGQRPFLIIDLFLDSPSAGSGEIRVLRFLSSTFDPRTMVGGDDPMAALMKMLQLILLQSGAKPLPDATCIKSPASRMYKSIEDYQGQVLGMWSSEGLKFEQ